MDSNTRRYFCDEIALLSVRVSAMHSRLLKATDQAGQVESYVYSAVRKLDEAEHCLRDGGEMLRRWRFSPKRCACGGFKYEDHDSV